MNGKAGHRFGGKAQKAGGRIGIEDIATHGGQKDLSAALRAESPPLVELFKTVAASEDGIGGLAQAPTGGAQRTGLTPFLAREAKRRKNQVNKGA